MFRRIRFPNSRQNWRGYLMLIFLPGRSPAGGLTASTEASYRRVACPADRGRPTREIVCPDDDKKGESGRRSARAEHLPRNRTCAGRIRLFGMAGYYPRHRPVHDLNISSGSLICAGALMVAQILRKRSHSVMSPRSAKYALRSPRSTAGEWLNAQIDCRPS